MSDGLLLALAALILWCTRPVPLGRADRVALTGLALITGVLGLPLLVQRC